jgi:hypothetical protein
MLGTRRTQTKNGPFGKATSASPTIWRTRYLGVQGRSSQSPTLWLGRDVSSVGHLRRFGATGSRKLGIPSRTLPCCQRPPAIRAPICIATKPFCGSSC